MMDQAWDGLEIKKIIKNYKNRFLLKLINWGDADMINFIIIIMNLFYLWLQRRNHVDPPTHII